ncbi:hypothetical protein ACFY96_23920 [Streptomyces massasporeus]
MGDLAKSVLGGAWTLLVGWILPTALNLAVLQLAVAPSLRGLGPLERLRGVSGLGTGLTLLTGALLLGLVATPARTPSTGSWRGICCGRPGPSRRAAGAAAGTGRSSRTG